MGFAETQSANPRNVRPPGPNAPAAGQRWPVSDPRKRAADLVLAGLLIVLLLPLLLGIIAIIRCDGGPALFRQPRLGAAGTSFICLKFRTMRTNAELALLEFLAGNPQAAREWAEHCKLRDDPRATAFGRLLRRLSLDELPQLFNVLRGEMSLVGPRPIVADEVARYGSAIDYYYRARPGLTGLWQVSGRSDLPYARRVELDVLYVRQHTLWLDLVILCRTFGAVLRQRGAR